jgi:hypothetical protein
MQSFPIARDREYLIPYVQAALAVARISTSGPAPGRRPRG